MLATGAMLSMLLPTIVLYTAAGRQSFSFSNVIGINIWLIILWAASLIIPFFIIIFNLLGKRENSRFNLILFSVAAIFTLVVYPILMQVFLVTGSGIAGGAANLAGGAANLAGGAANLAGGAANLAGGAAGLGPGIVGTTGINSGIAGGALGGVGIHNLGGITAAGISFRMGIGTILSGCFLIFGLIFALFVSLFNKSKKRKVAFTTTQGSPQIAEQPQQSAAYTPLQPTTLAEPPLAPIIIASEVTSEQEIDEKTSNS